MITKKDALSYLMQIHETELKMKKAYINLTKKLNDKVLINLFDSLQKEEQSHADLVNELEELVKKNWPQE
jgi:hypothetical protein